MRAGATSLPDQTPTQCPVNCWLTLDRFFEQTGFSRLHSYNCKVEHAAPVTAFRDNPERPP